jgi:hypothetical protein
MSRVGDGIVELRDLSFKLIGRARNPGMAPHINPMLPKEAVAAGEAGA